MPQAKLHVELIAYTPNPELVCALAGKLCYKGLKIDELKEKIDKKSIEKMLEHVIKAGHLSVLEHANFTFAIEGVSRVLTHQLVRHRLASYSQQSQRYVNEEEFSYIMPPTIPKDKTRIFEDAMENAKEAYKKLLKAGVPKEDARFVLPNAAETRIMVTMNARELLHFFELRTCLLAQWEIRNLANKMLELCKEVAPAIFKFAGPPCVTQKQCPEGKRSCGLWKTIPGARLKEW